jgi:hypothetical protein
MRGTWGTHPLWANTLFFSGTWATRHMSKCVIKTKSQDLYCVRTGTPPHFYAIQCQAYGLQYLISYMGPYGPEKEAEEIFSTLE